MGDQNRLKEIYDGFKNYVFPDKKMEKIAVDRISICYNCPFFINKRCKKCGCFMPAKVRSLQSKCPIGNW